MADKTLDVTLIIRNDTAEKWASENPVLSKGEIGVEIDTRKFKIGDGVTAWVALRYASGGNVEVKTDDPTASDIDYEVGTIWLNTAKSKIYMLFARGGNTAVWVEIPTTNGKIASATAADKLTTPRTITLEGAVVQTSKNFDGSGNITFTLVLANSGVAAGTFTKITVNEKGIVTGATTLTADDIPTLNLSKISDAGTAANKDVGTGAGNVPLLDANGKLNTSVLPSLALTETFTVASQTAMLALNAQQGDVAIRTDESKTYILTANTPSVLSAWVVMQTPDCKVLSVNGKTGAITLTTSDIAEGANLYFTPERATSNFNTNFAAKSVTGLSDGDKVVLSTDTITLNGGNA